jgi:hypothetical protein
MREHQPLNATGPKPNVVSKTRARQGVTGHNVRYVLGFGLAGIVIAFAIIYLFFFAAY